jgi:hypothetical protein
MEHISIYPVEGKLKDGESVLLGKIHEIIAWINDHDKRLAPIQFLECQPGGWISVKDRLPDPGQDYDCVQVLVYYRDQVTGQMDMCTEYFWKDSVIIDNDVPGFCIYGITHWMPLPAAPEDK